MIEHLVGRHGQPGGAQLYAVHLSDQKGWSQDLSLPRPHLRVGSGGKGVLLEILVYPRPSEGKHLCFVSVPMAAVVVLVFMWCSLGLCHPTITAVLSIML